MRGNIMRGRPAITRARVLNYIEAHRPTSIMQIVRATGADRRHVQRMVRSLEKMHGPDFCRMVEAIPCL